MRHRHNGFVAYRTKRGRIMHRKKPAHKHAKMRDWEKWESLTELKEEPKRAQSFQYKYKGKNLSWDD